MRVVELLFGNIRLAEDDQRRSGLRLPQRFHRGQGDRLLLCNHAACPVAGWKQLQHADDQPGDHAEAHENASLLHVFLAKQVERADGTHDERASNHRSAHVVGILQPRPRIQHQLPEAGQLERTVGGALVADRVLHPGIGRNNEVARQPRAQEDHQRREPVHSSAQPLLAVEKQPEEGRFQEEGETAFHGQRLSDDAAGEAREVRPVGAELKFHRNSGHHADDKVDAERSSPRSGPPGRSFVVGLDRQRFQNHDQRRQSHRQLREQVVVGHRESELQAVDQECAIHAWTSVRSAVPALQADLYRVEWPGNNEPLLSPPMRASNCDPHHRRVSHCESCRSYSGLNY